MSQDANTLQTDVVVVGGGLAGLTTAVALVRHGLRTIVVERDATLGGRARSLTDEKTGDRIDIGPHILLSEYPNMLALLDLLGTRDRIVWNRERFILMVDGQREIEMKHAPLPAPLHYMPSVWRDPTSSFRDNLSVLRVTLLAMQLTEEDILRLDSVNAAAFLRSQGVTEHKLVQFWAFTCMAIMNVPLELCSAGALLRFYRRLIGHSQYYVGFADTGLGDVFAPRARELIEESGSQVLLETAVAGFTGDRSCATGVALADGRRIEARYCVAALPPQALRRVARPEWLGEHESFRSLVSFYPSPYVSTYLWFDRKLTDLQFWARTFDKNDLSCDFYDLTNINRGWQDRPSVITTNCIFCERAADMSDDEIVAATIRELAEYLPDAARAELRHAFVSRIPMAIHCPFPGTEKLRQPVRSPVRNLYLAGDWIRTGLPSSMESAAKAGWLAAEKILAEAGRPQALAIEAKEIEGISGLVYRGSRLLRRDPLPRWLRTEPRSRSA